MDEQTEQELYRLARENNRMLHSMRRNAFWGGIIKFILYALLLLAPVWFYMTYLNGAVQQLIQTMQKVQGAGTSAQVQINSFGEALKQFESKIPGFSSTSTQ